MKKTDAWVRAHTDPEGYDYIQNLKRLREADAKENAALQRQLLASEQAVQNMDRELVKLRRELAEARSR